MFICTCISKIYNTNVWMIKIETNEVSVRYIFNMAKSTYRYDDFKVRVEFIFFISILSLFSHKHVILGGVSGPQEDLALMGCS